MENVREKDYYHKKIAEMLEMIKNPVVLNYIYVIIVDILKEGRAHE